MIEYLEEEHIYLIDGVIVPSVTQILQKIFPDKYKNIPKWILEKKAEYGTEVHKAIEDIEAYKLPNLNSVYSKVAVEQYKKIKSDYCFKVLEQEKIVHYKKYYAGRFDIILEINNSICLCDIKTTSELDKKYLSWQLSMYELAYGKRFDKLYCLWLPKGGLGKLVEIERIEKEEIERKLEEIEKC